MPKYKKPTKAQLVAARLAGRLPTCSYCKYLKMVYKKKGCLHKCLKTKKVLCKPGKTFDVGVCGDFEPHKTTPESWGATNL